MMNKAQGEEISVIQWSNFDIKFWTAYNKPLEILPPDKNTSYDFSGLILTLKFNCSQQTAWNSPPDKKYQLYVYGTCIYEV